MKGLRFLDFDLTFQRSANGYRVQADSPAGQAAVEFALPFSDLEIENFLLRFGRARQPMRRLGNPQIEAARAFGGRLFDAAFSGEVRSCLRSSLDDAQRQEAGLRIRLRLADAPDLNDLPWEFLLHPALGRFLALSAETPLVRYLDLPERLRPLAVKPPLEVLTVISSPTDCPQLDVEAEWRKLQESLAELEERGLLILRRLESPTLTHLQRWLRRQTCHILHFIGHGGFNPKTEDGLLLFTDENARGREVTGQTLGTLLHDHRPLRLAVLNACEGARTSRTDPFAGVAQSLVQQGIPAVVAMQFEISDKAAITFAHELYAAVVDGYPVDAALAEARKALFFAGHELEWGTPVLYMRSPDGRIFDIEPAAAPAAAAKPEPIESRPAPAEVKPAPAAPKTPPPQEVEKTPPVEPLPAAIIGTIKEEPTAAKPGPIESRPAPAEVKPVPATPKAPPPEAPAKALPVEPAPAANTGKTKEEPTAAKPKPIQSRPAAVEVRPVPAAPKASPPESAAKTPPAALKAPSIENPPPAVSKPAPVQTQKPPAEPRPAEAKTTKAAPLAAFQEPGRPQRGGRMPIWFALVALLGLAVFVATRFIPGNGEGEGQAPEPDLQEQVIPEPAVLREAGVYLTTGVKAGVKITTTTLELVEGESPELDEPRTLNDVIGFCATTDLESGQKLSWNNLTSCP
jgi:hypothetical protein